MRQDILSHLAALPIDPISMGIPIILAGIVLVFGIYFMKRAGARRRAAAAPDYSEAIGHIATVSHLVSPVQRPGGQVVVTIQGKLMTLDALQKGSQPLTAGAQVRVIAKKDPSTLLVEAL
jgi:hypothetical protein